MRFYISICLANSIKTKNIQNRVLISIADNGCGIREENKQKIFDPFFTSKAIGSGTGLGLSIAYQIIVDKHHGKLHSISNLNQGTEFQIEIPIHH